MDLHVTNAKSIIFDAGEAVTRVIVRAKSSQHALVLSNEVVAKLIEAQQAIFAAQRLMEK